MQKPIVILDLETTGTDILRDKAIQLAALRFENDFNRPVAELNLMINPEMPISPNATEVHGITDQDVVLKKTFKEQAQEIFSFLAGADYGGFNHVQFDIPMLSEEFARCGYEWPERGSRFLDAMKVFKGMEKRDLLSAIKFYCGDDHTNAHDAMADIVATHRVLLAQMERYPELHTPEKIADFCTDSQALDFAGKIILDESGMAVYSFGKDKGKSVTLHPGFGLWMLKNDFPTNTKNIVRALIKSPA